MINIKIPRDPLTASILHEDSERLYIELTNELVKYAKLLGKKSLLHQKNEIILFKLSSSDIGGESKEFLNGLEIQRRLIPFQENTINNQMNETLNRIHETILNIKEIQGKGKKEYQLVEDNYSLEQKDAISAFVELRKASYEIVEFVGSFFIRKEVPKDRLTRNLFAIALSSLKTFDIDDILKDPNIKTITSLMTTITELYKNKTIRKKQLEEIKNNINNETYSEIIHRLEEPSYEYSITAIK